MDKSIKSSVYLDLKKIGCCNRCCLRYLGEKYANYEEPEKYLEELLLITIEEKDVNKKLRLNPCIACLGLLEESFFCDLLAHSFWTEMRDFEFDSFRINLFTPPNIEIRSKSLHCHIKQKFSEFYDQAKLDESVPLLTAVFKQSFKTKLESHAGRKYDTCSGMQLGVMIHHEDNDKEVKVMLDLDPHVYKRRKCLSDKMFGKNAVISTLSTVKEETFLRYVSIPPEIPTSSLRIESVEIETLPMYIGGRYCKYSRLLSQTPWIIDADNEDDSVNMKTKLIDSVQDKIFDGIHSVLGLNKNILTFSASGREDLDVRCLGRGRPFYIKIGGRKHISYELFREMEKTINKCTDVAVFDMQNVDKGAIRMVKVGEEMKKKVYIALCLIRNGENCEEIVEKLNKIGTTHVTIQQKTPVRVTHRRTMAERTKQIFYMKAAVVPSYNNLFQLMVESQSGTYIKEFIHGDFGRTVPSISDLTRAEIECFKLDVVDIDLDWPPKINSPSVQLSM